MQLLVTHFLRHYCICICHVCRYAVNVFLLFVYVVLPKFRHQHLVKFSGEAQKGEKRLFLSLKEPSSMSSKVKTRSVFTPEPKRHCLNRWRKEASVSTVWVSFWWRIEGVCVRACVCVCSLLPVAPPPLIAHTSTLVFSASCKMCDVVFVCFDEVLSYALHFSICIMKIMNKRSTHVNSQVDFVNQFLKLLLCQLIYWEEYTQPHIQLSFLWH